MIEVRGKTLILLSQSHHCDVVVVIVNLHQLLTIFQVIHCVPEKVTPKYQSQQSLTNHFSSLDKVTVLEVCVAETMLRILLKLLRFVSRD